MADQPLVRTPTAWPVVRRVTALRRRVAGRLWSFDQVQWDGVRYGDDAPQALHVWEPDDLAPRDGWPAVLLLHGGGWVEGSWQEFESLGAQLCRRGMVVAAANYRLARDHAWPAPLDDAHGALDRVFGMQVDPARVAVWGHSAGGHLALLAAQRRPQDLCGVVAVGAPTDLVAHAAHSDLPLAEIFGGAEGLQRASPLHLEGRLPPTLLLHGAADPVVSIDQSRWLRDRRPTEVRLVEVEGGDHGLRWPPRAALRARRGAIDQLVAWQDHATRGSKWRRRKKKAR